MLREKTCCFFGHRQIEDTPALRAKVVGIVETLIVKEDVDTFLFGSKSAFNSLCYNLVTKTKEKYPHIKRVYVRGEYADIPDFYEEYLLEGYEQTYYPRRIRGAGRASYVERNYEMINQSAVCVVYYDENYAPPRRRKGYGDLRDYQPKSGTAIAYQYAVKKNIRIFNCLSEDLSFSIANLSKK